MLGWRWLCAAAGRGGTGRRSWMDTSEVLWRSGTGTALGLRCRVWERGSGLTRDSVNTVPRGRSFLRRSEGPRGGVRPEDRGVITHDSVGERGSVRGRGWQDPRAGRLQKGRHSVATGSLGFPEESRGDLGGGDSGRDGAEGRIAMDGGEGRFANQLRRRSAVKGDLRTFERATHGRRIADSERNGGDRIGVDSA